jgi:N-acetylglutamate synthase-like GNAT family acetyltransferase
VAFVIRKAVPDDIRVLTPLIASSVRALQVGDYTAAQIEGALGIVYAVDSQLVNDGTYYVVEEKGKIVACGAWSKRKTPYGGDACFDREDSLLDPATDPARIRGFFVHPGWARRGIGTLILKTCEKAARDAGFQRFELTATRTGVALYRVHGYEPVEHKSLALPNGEELPVVRMAKPA